MKTRPRSFAAGILAVLLLAGCMLPDAAEKSAAMQKIKDGALVVDVRTRKDYKAGHYSGATNIPLGEIEKCSADLGDRGRPIVVYCNIGAAAGIAKKKLLKAGYTDVTNAGGLSDLRQ